MTRNDTAVNEPAQPAGDATRRPSAGKEQPAAPALVRARDRVQAPLAVTVLGLGLVGLSSPVPWGEFAMIGALAVSVFWGLLEIGAWASARIADA